MNPTQLLEVDKQNRKLLEKMGSIFAGRYKSTTITEFRSKPKTIISKGDQRLKDHNNRVQFEN